MDTLWQDIKFGVRTLARRPEFTLVSILTLALGIGANTAIFSVVHGVLLRPLPFPDADRLVLVWEKNAKHTNRSPVSIPNYADWRDRNTVFEEIAAVDFALMNLTGDAEPQRLRATTVSGGFFEALGVAPALGRALRRDEDRTEGGRSAVLSHALWASRFGSDPLIAGKTITLDGQVWTVAGVMPVGFDFPGQIVGDRIDLWVPMSFPQTEASRGLRRLGVVARLKRDVTLEQARSEMSRIAHDLSVQYPVENPDGGAAVVPLLEQLTGDIRQSLWILLGAVAFVLLIACANVANLALARGAAREREMAIRSAMGAGRARVIRQLLTESALIALTGGALGGVIALWGTDLLGVILPEHFPRSGEIAVDLPVWSFTLAISAATGLLFGLAPALRGARADLGDALKQEGRTTSGGGRRQRSSRWLVAGEVALSMILLVGAGLLARSFYRLVSVAPGFEPDHILTAYVSLPPSRYGTDAQKNDFVDRLLPALRTLPGVRGAAVTRYLPLGEGNAYFDVTVRGASRPAQGPGPAAFWRVVSPGYFAAMGIPVLRGRDFGEGETATSPGVVLISETTARMYFAGADPIGQHLKVALPEEEAPWLEVVGIVGDVHHRSLAEAGTPEVYVPYAQSPAPFMSLVLRTEGDPVAVAPALRAEVSRVDRMMPVAEVKPMRRVLARSLSQQRARGVLMGIFSVLALVLATIGIYGVMAQAVAQRRQEIGVRMALGAEPKSIVRLFLGRGMTFALAGVAAGAAGAFALTRLIASQLFGVTPTDLPTFAGVGALLLAVALAACWIPARRAARVDPVVALRHE